MIRLKIKHPAVLVAVATLGIFSLSRPAQAVQITVELFESRCPDGDAGSTLSNPCYVMDGRYNNGLTAHAIHVGLPLAVEDPPLTIGFMGPDINPMTAVAEVPEPASLLLLGTGLMVIGRHWRRRAPKA